MLNFSYLILIIVGVVLWVIFLISFLIPRIIFKVNPKEFELLIQEIRNTGRLLLSNRCGGRMGWINFTFGFLGVEIYNTGIIIKPVFLQSVAVKKEEITEIKNCHHLITPGIKIVHKSDKIRGSIYLYLRLEENIVQELMSK
ncbi:MAG TPA: hypothetical protein VJH75_02530 [Patescibacteria group bacterium]|nr:hypothetical protein [Patescibacteria group bacterium]